MTKKFDVRVQPLNDATYTAEVVRRRTPRGTVVERSKSGFGSHAQALLWANAELASYLEQRSQARNADKARRARGREFENHLSTMTFQAKAVLVKEGTHPRVDQVRDSLRYAMESLWESYAHEMVVKHHHPEQQGIAMANRTVGKNWTQRFEHALSGALDGMTEVLHEASIERAVTLAETFRKSQHQASSKALLILNSLRQLPGKKILTLCLDEPQVFDVNEAGQVGYAPNHEALLLHALDAGLNRQGALIVRQFIPGTREAVTAPNGKLVTMPWKAIYGVMLGLGTFQGLCAEDIEEDCAVQPDGSRRSEPFVIYKDTIDWLPIDPDMGLFA